MRTPKADYATYLLGRPVEDWIADRRASGRTWRQVSQDLEEATGGKIRAAAESVRSWSLRNLQDDAA
jgi:hypothetical protein